MGHYLGALQHLAESVEADVDVFSVLDLRGLRKGCPRRVRQREHRGSAEGPGLRQPRVPQPARHDHQRVLRRLRSDARHRAHLRLLRRQRARREHARRLLAAPRLARLLAHHLLRQSLLLPVHLRQHLPDGRPHRRLHAQLQVLLVRQAQPAARLHGRLQPAAHHHPDARVQGGHGGRHHPDRAQPAGRHLVLRVARRPRVHLHERRRPARRHRRGRGAEAHRLLPRQQHRLGGAPQARRGRLRAQGQVQEGVQHELRPQHLDEGRGVPAADGGREVRARGHHRDRREGGGRAVSGRPVACAVREPQCAGGGQHPGWRGHSYRRLRHSSGKAPPPRKRSEPGVMSCANWFLSSPSTVSSTAPRRCSSPPRSPSYSTPPA